MSVYNQDFEKLCRRNSAFGYVVLSEEFREELARLNQRYAL